MTSNQVPASLALAESGAPWAWAVAEEQVAEAELAGRLAVGEGKRGLRARHVARFALVFFHCLARTACLWVSSLRIKSWNEEEFSLLVGFGGGAETSIYSQLAAGRSDLKYIVTPHLEELAAISRPRFLCLCVEVIRALLDLAHAYSVLGWAMFPVLPAGRHASRARSVAWCRACLRDSAKRLSSVTVVSIDEVSHALAECCVDRVQFHQHGLLKRTVALAPFARIVCLTAEEKENFESRSSAVVSLAEVQRVLPDRDATCAILGLVYLPTDRLRVVEPFLRFLDGLGVTVIVRHHPSTSDMEGREWLGRYVVDDASRTFLESLKTYRPTLVVSWFSTTLALALRAGILPVCVSDPDEAVFDQMIYPMRERVLFWPRDERLIARAIRVHGDYGRVVDDLTKGGGRSEFSG